MWDLCAKTDQGSSYNISAPALLEGLVWKFPGNTPLGLNWEQSWRQNRRIRILWTATIPLSELLLGFSSLNVAECGKGRTQTNLHRRSYPIFGKTNIYWKLPVSDSQFLCYTQAQSHCDTQALIINATHEEKKLGNLQKSSDQGTFKPSLEHSEIRFKQWCSHCKNGSYSTNGYKLKTINTCNYCKNKGHEECRKKKLASYSHSTQIHKANTKLFCHYCKSDEHEITDCEVLKKKKSQDMSPPNKDVRKVQIVKICVVEVEDKEPEPYKPNDVGSILIKLEWPELERTFVFQIDTGAGIYLIHKNHLPSHIILDDSIKLLFLVYSVPTKISIP